MSIIQDKIALKIRTILNNDGVIAFPTDTVWGAGCLVESSKGVEKIYSLKKRVLTKPLILLGKDIASLKPYVKHISNKAQYIINKHLPGALTIILPKSDLTPEYITSGFDTVGIRIPDNKTFIEILDKCTDSGVLATTSANLSGNIAGNCKQDVINEIGSEIDYIVDDYGYTSQGRASTVIIIDKDDSIKVLRQGNIYIEANND